MPQLAPVLLIDIGNTSTTLATVSGGRIRQVQRRPSDTPGFELSKIPAYAVLASVKPDVTSDWETLLRCNGISQIHRVTHRSRLGIPVSYPRPRKIGADRLANACAAAARFKPPVVVCDFGTALTFDVVTAQDGYAGGIICPGLPLMFDYLAEKTALLPHIKPTRTDQVIGRSTTQAMRSGARLGYRGMVREVLAALRKELGVRTLRAVATGGFADWVFDGWDLQVPVDPQLTLKGLARIAELIPPA